MIKQGTLVKSISYTYLQVHINPNLPIHFLVSQSLTKTNSKGSSQFKENIQHERLSETDELNKGIRHTIKGTE